MEQEQMKSVPYVVFESEMIRHERTIKRFIIALIISVVLLAGSNALWLYEWCQYDYNATKTVDVDSKQGDANYIGNNGDINNGKN